MAFSLTARARVAPCRDVWQMPVSRNPAGRGVPHLNVKMATSQRFQADRAV